MIQPSKFWDGIAAKYAANPIQDPEAYEYTLGRTRSYLTPSDRVLEIGAGTGSTALLLAGHVASITGTDISGNMIDIAKTKAREGKVENAEFTVASAIEAAGQAGKYTVVAGFNILHLTDDLDLLLRTLHDHMPGDSLLITKTPCVSDPAMGLKRFAIRAVVPLMQLIGKAPYLRYLTVRQLEDSIEKAGFKIIETCSRPAMSRYIVARRA